MPDITMCRTEDCSLKQDCHRSPASGTRPSEWRQSWSAFSPYGDSKGSQGCKDFWPKRDDAAAGRAALSERGGR